MLKTMTTYFDPASDQAARREMLKPWIDESRALLKLAAPLIAMQLAQIGSLTADIIMVGELGKEAIAAIGIGAVMFYFTWLIGYGPVMAISPIIAQILGAHPNDRARMRAAVRMGLWAVALVSLPLMLFLVWARPDLGLLRAGSEDRGDGRAVGARHRVRHSLHAGLRRVARLCDGARASERGVGDLDRDRDRQHRRELHADLRQVRRARARHPGLGHWHGVRVRVLVLRDAGRGGRSRRRSSKYRLLHRFTRPDWAKFKEVFRLGAPIGMSMMFEAMLFNAATLMMGTFGAASVAAHQIAMNVGSVTFMVPLGIGIAATVRVGLFAGAKNAEGVRRAGYTAIVFGAGFMLICAVVIALIPETLVGLYIPVGNPENADVVKLAVTFLYVAAMFQLFDALQVTGQLSLRGLKDAQVPMWIAGLSYWLVGFTCAWGLGKWAGMRRLRRLDRPRRGPRGRRHRHGLALRRSLTAQTITNEGRLSAGPPLSVAW